MTREQIEQLLESPYSREDWKNLIETIFDEVEFASSIEEIEVDETMASSARYLGRAMIEESSVDIGLYEVELKEKVVLERNRVGLRNLLRRDLAYHDGAFVVYHSPNSEEQEGKWRLSFVSETKYYDEDGEERDRKTEPKRFTYMLGKNEKVRTARDRFLVMLSKRGDVELKDIFEAFSVEKLSKSFFDEYKAYYERFCDNLITNDSYWISVFGENDKRVRDFVKKLLGRIVFLYFIEKKGWLGVDADKDWGEGDLNFLSNLFERSKENDLDEIFYSDVLTKLFFEALNTERDNDLISIIEGEEPYKVPFLNGGLFERELNTIGGINFEPKLFEDLFAFFARYNFTIYEDDPNDQTVAVDPEMLGHIFENLLEDNKDKGAFYTPKEIVHYMCQQSLIEYLAEGRDDREAIERLVEMKEVEGIEPSELDEIETKIDEVKICDPAIGSGAFPMGLLLEIFSIKQIIWNEKHGSLESFNAAETKTDIIQNSIYGVDIEKGAIDIARLRFWLSLVVDEAIPKPLPNLDYKIVEGNSLISLYEGEVVDIEPSRGRIYAASFDQAGQDSAQLLELHKTLIQEYQKHFKCVDKQEKDELSKSIRDIKIDILISSISNMIATKGTDNEPIRTKFKNNKRYVDACNLYTLTEKWRSMVAKLTQLKSEPNEKLSFFNWYIDFPDIMSPKLNPNPGFDIVIGNPPYVQLQRDGGKLGKLYSDLGYKTYARTGDIYALFYEKGIELLKNGGVETYITSNKWMRAGYGKSLRNYLLSKNPVKLIDLGGGVFESATVDTNILIIKKEDSQDKLEGYTMAEKTKDFSSIELVPVKPERDEIWTILNPIELSIKKKIESVGTPLKDWDINIYRGVLTGCNEAFIISGEKKQEILDNCQTEEERKRTDELIRPILRGRDIKRYSYEFADLWIIATFPAKHINLEEYPAVKQYLLDFGIERLEQTGQTHVINGEVIKSRKKTNNKWFEIQDSIGYWEEFSKQKIAWASVGGTFYSFIDKDYFLLDTNYFFTSEKDIDYLIGVLNSKLVTFWINSEDTKISDSGAYRHYKYNLERLNIPLNNTRQTNKIKEHIIKKEYREIDKIVFSLYELTQEEIDYIELVVE